MDHVKSVQVDLESKLATVEVESASLIDAMNMLPSFVTTVKVQSCTTAAASFAPIASIASFLVLPAVFVQVVTVRQYSTSKDNIQQGLSL